MRGLPSQGPSQVRCLKDGGRFLASLKGEVERLPRELWFIKRYISALFALYLIHLVVRFIDWREKMLTF